MIVSGVTLKSAQTLQAASQGVSLPIQIFVPGQYVNQVGHAHVPSTPVADPAVIVILLHIGVGFKQKSTPHDW